jgi:tRNA pseudouridine32 synthase/23S rRNA pseudouridine746 synthase
VHFDSGEEISLDTPYQAGRRICYYREVVNEPEIPFEEQIVFENDDFLLADKPHFLPVHPTGKFVNETLLSRLRAKYGYVDLCSAHRLDRLTAGLVLCVKNKAVRGCYQQMFRHGSIKKTYLAAGRLPAEAGGLTHWHIKARMGRGREYFRMKILEEEPVNSESMIELIEQRGEIGLFRLRPITGQKHQLRVHMCAIGSGILNDPLYPDCAAEEEPVNYHQPLQLLAHRLEFIDPVTRVPMQFTSRQSLQTFPTATTHP